MVATAVAQVVASGNTGPPLASEYIYPTGSNPGFNPSTGIASNPPPATQSATAGAQTAYTAYGWMAVGQNPVGTSIDWYIDGVLVYTNTLGPSGGSTNEGVTFFDATYTAGTHTVYAIIGGNKTNTITVTAA